MKKQKTTAGHCIIAIYSEDKKGLLGQVLVLFNKLNYEVNSLNVSRTDISDVVLITIEACVPEARLGILLQKIEKIVEVYRANAYQPGEMGLEKVGFFRLSKQIFSGSFWSLVQKYGAVVSSMSDDALVLRKFGSDRNLQEFYGQLDGPHLLGFCKSGLIAEESLLSVEEFGVDRN
ncbi:MAG: hypothetical protein ABJA76_16950 [Mucilaginibacter sp.]